MFPRPLYMRPVALALASLIVIGLSTAFSARPLRLSSWRGPDLSATFNPVMGVTAGSLEGSGAKRQTIDQAGGERALEAYNQASVLQESAGGGLVRFYRRDLGGGGALAYFVVLLDDRVRVALITADGATPGTDERGDTIWADRQQHLATVEQMAQAPYAVRPRLDLLGALAFGFHGDVRTSDEGTVVIDGQLY